MHKDDFESLLNTHLKSVFNFVFRIIQNKEKTEDIVQDTFVKVWKNLHKYDPKQNFKTWIFTIARNTTYDFLRKNKEINFSEIEQKNDFRNSKDVGEEGNNFSESIPDLEPLPQEIFERKELAEELETALSKIRPDYREVILLHNFEELTFDEISKIVDKPLNTVKSQYRRALFSIKKLLIP